MCPLSYRFLKLIYIFDCLEATLKVWVPYRTKYIDKLVLFQVVLKMHKKTCDIVLYVIVMLEGYENYGNIQL